MLPGFFYYIAFMSWPFLAAAAAHLSHFMPVAAAALQHSLVAGVEAEQVAQDFVAAQLERKRAPVAAMRRVMVFMNIGVLGGCRILCPGDL